MARVVRRDLRGRFIGAAASRGSTYSLRDSRGRTQYYSGGKRISREKYREYQGVIRERRREADRRSRKQAEDVGIEHERMDSFRAVAVPRIDVARAEKGAARGNHIKDMGAMYLDAAPNLAIVRAQLAHDPRFMVDENDVIVLSIDLTDSGRYRVRFAIDWSSNYDEEEEEEE